MVDESSTWLGGPLDDLYALFGGNQAHLQVTPAVPRSKAGPMAVRETEQPTTQGTASAPIASGPQSQPRV